eukprot:scaffold3319_cov258-Pinguiococcus_pyrenoidosus.AAC.17
MVLEFADYGPESGYVTRSWPYCAYFATGRNRQSASGANRCGFGCEGPMERPDQLEVRVDPGCPFSRTSANNGSLCGGGIPLCGP